VGSIPIHHWIASILRPARLPNGSAGPLDWLAAPAQLLDFPTNSS
jgi:hypothetical protein